LASIVADCGEYYVLTNPTQPHWMLIKTSLS
jgi:hypothetical protein